MYHLGLTLYYVLYVNMPPPLIIQTHETSSAVSYSNILEQACPPSQTRKTYLASSGSNSNATFLGFYENFPLRMTP